jgi:hypothetical protein
MLYYLYLQRKFFLLCSESYGDSKKWLNNCIPVRKFLRAFMLVSVSDTLAQDSDPDSNFVKSGSRSRLC